MLVISHDDKYFGSADRIIKLDYGKLAPEGGEEFLLNGHSTIVDLALETAR